MEESEFELLYKHDWHEESPWFSTYVQIESNLQTAVCLVHSFIPHADFGNIKVRVEFTFDEFKEFLEIFLRRGKATINLENTDKDHIKIMRTYEGRIRIYAYSKGYGSGADLIEHELLQTMFNHFGIEAKSQLSNQKAR